MNSDMTTTCKEIDYQHFKCAKPLDFSYRKLESLEELNGNEKSLLRTKGAPKKNRRSNRYRTGSFWLNNNNLKSVNGLRNLADRLLEMADYLSWLDLSGNNLTMVSHIAHVQFLVGFFQEFLLFPNLSMLYLHQNEIEDFVEVYKLRELGKLRTLTLNNNPMCTNPKYRSTIVQLLPKIRKLDNVVVLRSERELKSLSICKGIQVRLKKSYPDDFSSSGVLKTD